MLTAACPHRPAHRTPCPLVGRDATPLTKVAESLHQHPTCCLFLAVSPVFSHFSPPSLYLDTMYTNNNTNNSRKENYSHSNFLFYNNNKNNKRAGVALFVVSARPAPWKENKNIPLCCLSEGNKGAFYAYW